MSYAECLWLEGEYTISEVVFKIGFNRMRVGQNSALERLNF